ncbi:MAG: sigma 54-interacting transcriptional regulator [Nitrospirae bacterium]|nr:sigma 54-interacting transcriptional regulator [Nitrospirota bacterium]
MQTTIMELKKYAKTLSVLYAEDDDTTREEVYHMLMKFFSTVEMATNGEEALQSYKRRQYDLVISDIRMPVMDGIKMAAEIKEINKYQTIIILSAYNDSEYLFELINIGIDKFITKPLDNHKFLETLLQTCKNITYEKEIQRYKTNTEAIFRSVGDAIITLDNDMKIIEANDAVRHICGVDKEVIIGKRFKSAFGSCSMGCHDTLERTLKDATPAKINHVECCKKGKKGLVTDITTYPLLDGKGMAYGVVMVIKDESYTSLLESEIGQRRRFYKLVGKSDAMQRVYSLIENLADLKTTVLITGESGVGKELVAEAIHYYGNRSSMPLVKVNCSALSEGLLESELFGHVKGSFTGAVKDRAGRFQMADGGTILLDEIGDIANSIQLRLLRVLQDLEFERVGDSTPIKINARVIVATNKDLKALVAAGKFREDLYYRLNVIEIHVPPLRQRREDIPMLVRHFIDRFNIMIKKDIKDVSNEVMRVFMTHPFNGNIRELQHVIEHAFVLCNSSVITLDDLPAGFVKTGESLGVFL